MNTETLPVRRAEISRQTSETNIRAFWETDGSGIGDIGSGIAFFDHMLMQLVRHGHFDVTLRAEGDLQIDAHHTMEDCGIVLGQAIAEALGDKAGICRFGYAYAPLDEALARVVVDLSGRPGLEYHVVPSRSEVGGLDADLFREFFQALANAAKLTLHIDLLRGINAHHQIEAVFKAFGLALAAAVRRRGDATAPSTIPSTKGRL